MELTLFTEEVIDGAHFLPTYDGKCRNMHGHSWLIKIWFRGDSLYLDKDGILVDFTAIKEVKDRFDHKLLNDVIGIVTPTAEHLTEIIYGLLKTDTLKAKGIKVKVRVYENAVLRKSYCEGGDW